MVFDPSKLQPQLPDKQGCPGRFQGFFVSFLVFYAKKTTYSFCWFVLKVYQKKGEYVGVFFSVVFLGFPMVSLLFLFQLCHGIGRFTKTLCKLDIEVCYLCIVWIFHI